MDGLLVYNGSLMGANFIELFESLENAAKERGHSLIALANNQVLPFIHNGKLKLKLPFEPDFVIFWNKDTRLARLMEKMGMRLFNSVNAIELCDDKIATTIALANNDIPMPDTVFAPCLHEVAYSTPCEMHSYEQLKEALGMPIVVKEAFGSFGTQVYLANNKAELEALQKKLRYIPHMYQRFIKSSFGRDYRIQIVGGKNVACMLRVNKHDFRANITGGGEFYPFTPSKEAIALAKKCAQILGADFAGVDMMFGEDGEPIVCEVNSNAFFKKLGQVSNCDVAKEIINYIIESMTGDK